MNNNQNILKWLPILLLLATIVFLLEFRSAAPQVNEETGIELNSSTNEQTVEADSQPVGEGLTNQANAVLDEQSDELERNALGSAPVLSEEGLKPAPIPQILAKTRPNHSFLEHEVSRGETPNIIAQTYGIEPSTLLGGNPILSQESALLQVGAILNILPVDGVLHEVKLGDTLEIIAENYGVNVEDIIKYEPNSLTFPYRLEPQTELVIPGAEPRLFLWSPPPLPEVDGSFTVFGTGTYIWPVNDNCITQFYWYGHPGIDVATVEGTPTYATDRGTVTWTGWASGGYFDYGILVVVNHGNGVESFYAHLSDVAVFLGQVVEQGNLVGYTGNTGRSSGPHLHFELRLNNGRVNPFWDGYLFQNYQDCTYLIGG